MSGLRLAVRGDSELVRVCSPPLREVERPDVVFCFGNSPTACSPPAGDGPPVVYWGVRPEHPLGSRERAIGRFEGAWKAVPLPVADELFADVVDEAVLTAVWASPAGARRREYTSGFSDGVEVREPSLPFRPVPGAIAVNLREKDDPLFAHHAAAAMAAGCVLVSEPVERALGLEPGIDHIEGQTLDEIHVAVETVVASRTSFIRMRLNGRRKAENFRASRVLDRVAVDLLNELA